MKAAYITGYQPQGTLEYAELDPPRPRAGEVLVRVKAASVNPVDVKIWKGMLKRALKLQFPQVLGLDLSGEVVAAPAGSRFKVGDQVFGTSPRSPSAFAEFAAIKEQALAHKPQSLSHEQASALPLVALTAWQAMFEIAQLKAGEKVFIQAGGGGFGSVAVQLAKAAGAYVSTTASSRHHALLKELGADLVVDYKTQAYEQVVRDQDVAIEVLDDMLSRTLQVVRDGGRVVSLVGPPDKRMLSAMGVPGPLAWLLGNLASKRARSKARARNIDYHAMFVRADGARLEQLAEQIEQGSLRPIVDRTFALEDAKSALEYVASGHASGKVILQM